MDYQTPHPIEEIIMSSLVPTEKGEITIEAKGREKIKEVVVASIQDGTIEHCRVGSWIAIGFLRSQPVAAPAVRVLDELAKEFGPRVLEAIGEQQSNLEQAEAARGRFQRMMNDRTNKRAPLEGEDAPEGTIKQRDLAPPRNPKFMR